MSIVTQMATSIGDMLKSQNQDGINKGSALVYNGAGRATQLETSQNNKITGMENIRVMKKAQYQLAVDTSFQAFNDKVVLVKTVVDNQDNYKSLPELEAELAAEETALVAQATSIQSAVNAALDVRINAWGVASDADAAFAGFDAQALLVV
jgi:hypothetical protein